MCWIRILLGFKTDFALGFFFFFHKLVYGLKTILNWVVVLLFHGSELKLEVADCDLKITFIVYFPKNLFLTHNTATTPMRM